MSCAVVVVAIAAAAVAATIAVAAIDDDVVIIVCFLTPLSVASLEASLAQALGSLCKLSAWPLLHLLSLLFQLLHCKLDAVCIIGSILLGQILNVVDKTVEALHLPMWPPRDPENAATFFQHSESHLE